MNDYWLASCRMYWCDKGWVLNYCTHALSLENVIVFCLLFFLVFSLSWQMTDRVNSIHHGKENTDIQGNIQEYKTLFNHVTYYCTTEEYNVMLEHYNKNIKSQSPLLYTSHTLGHHARQRHKILCINSLYIFL